MTPRASGSRDGVLIAKMHADEVEIDETLVRRLLGDQFPDWVDRPFIESSPKGPTTRSSGSVTTSPSGFHVYEVPGYGPANWVLNARAASEVALSRGGRSETYEVEEAGAKEAIPVLRKYITEIRVTRGYFDATPDSSDDAVAAELSRHAVFRLIPVR